jgi:hypothetical protein
MPTNLQLVYPDGFDRALRARVEEALRDLAEGDGPGAWNPLPDHIRIGRQFGDGLSGALVLSVEASWNGSSGRYVAKIGSIGEMCDEWQAYRRFVERTKTILYAPIEVVSRAVADNDRAADGDGAVLYRHVGRWAGVDDEPQSLEQVAAAALTGSAEQVQAAADAVARILRAVADVLCDAPELGGEQQGRAAAKDTLGADLHLAVTDLDPAGRRLDHAAFPTDRAAAQRTLSDHVVAAGLVLPRAERGSEPEPAEADLVGEFLHLSSAHLSRKDDRLRATRNLAVVDLVLEEPGPAEGLADRAAKAGLLGPHEVTVRGRVLSARSQERWARATAALPRLAAVEPGVIELDGARAAHPFSALRWVLRDRRTRVLTARAHGDLNALNVLVVGDLPFVIDYARTESGQPVLKDPAWLELNLLRHPLGDMLTFPQLLRVHRLLLLGDRVADVNEEKRWPSVTETLVDLVAHEPPAVAAALKILTAVRRAAQRVHRHADAEPWWQEYQVELLLAMHRAFKWTGALQTPGTWRAQIAAAAVACEALDHDPNTLLRHWPGAESAMAAERLLPLLPDTARALEPLAAVVGALTVRRPEAVWTDRLRHEVRAARAHVMSAVARDGKAERYLRECHAEHGAFIDLRGSVQRSLLRADTAVDSALTSVMDAPRAVIFGPSGAGKSSLFRELRYRLLNAALNSSGARQGKNSGVTGRLPVLLRADELLAKFSDGDPPASPEIADPRLAQLIDASLRDVLTHSDAEHGVVKHSVAGQYCTGSALLAAGAVHLLVDDVHLVAPHDVPEVLQTVRTIVRRFAEIPITVAFRGAKPPPELAGWTHVRLRGATRDQAERYLVHTWHGLDGTPTELAGAVRSALDSRALEGTDGWSPRHLSMLAALRTLRADRPLPYTWGDILELHYTEKLGQSPDSAVLRYAEDYARLLVETAKSGDSDMGPHEVERRLVETGILIANGAPAPRFETPDAQDYFAARWLRRQGVVADGDPDLVRDKALDHLWYAPTALLVSLADAPPHLREELVATAIDADPVQAGRLLRSIPGPGSPKRLAALFLDRQEQMLRDGSAGPAEHAEAAAALVAASAPRAYERLLRVAADEHAPASGRASCIRALIVACREAEGGRHETMLLKRFTACCSGLLQNDTAEEVLLAALEAVASLRLSQLGLLAAAYCTPRTRWPVARAAIAALEALGLPRPLELDQEFTRTRAAGLAALERSLSDGSVQDARSAHAELFELADALPPREKLRHLLAHRFRFEIGELAGDLIERELRASAPAARPERWEAVVRGEVDAPELLETLRDDDPIIAAAGLHRLLRAGDTAAAAAFRKLAQHDALDEAGRVAAIVRVLPAELLPQAVAYAHSLEPTADTPGDLDGLASLVYAVFLRNRPNGVTEARRTHGKLIAQGRADRYRYPWADALRRCTGSADNLEALLRSADESDREAALDVLGDHVFLLLGAPAPAVDRPLLARYATGLDELGPDSAPERISRAAVLAATAGSGADLSALLRLADRLLAAPEAATCGVPIALRGLGVVETSPAADLVAAAGYLARTVLPDEAERVHRWLVALDTESAHPSVQVGRLTALAYLGDWLPSTAAISAGTPRLAAIAANTVTHWLDGPCPSAPGPGHREVADWISLRLATGDLTPQARSTLFDLRRQAELRARRASCRRITTRASR